MAILTFIRGIRLGIPVQFGIILLIAAVFLFLNFDNDGFEGDDLNSVVPLMHLEEARDGMLEIYRYDWQPLFYQLSSAVFKIFNTPDAVFALSPFFISLSIAVLFLACQDVARTNIVLFLCFTWLAPELWYTGLYYNSSSASLLCIALAIYLANNKSSIPDLYRSLTTGLLIALAVLFRFDFILMSPVIFYLLWNRCGDLRVLFYAMATACMVGIMSLLTGLVDFQRLIDIYITSSNEIRALSDMPGWDRYTKTFVMTTVFSPFGFVYFLTGAIALFRTEGKRSKLKIGGFVLALSPVLLLFKDLLSVKYALPVLIFVPMAGTYIYQKIQISLPEKNRYLLPSFIVFATVFSLFFSVEPVKEAPFIKISASDYRRVGTHDGIRSWGAYFNQVFESSEANHTDENYIRAKEMLEQILNSENSMFIIEGEQNHFSEGSSGWRYLQLFLAKQGFSSYVAGPEVVIYEVRDNLVVLCTNMNTIDGELNNTGKLQVILQQAASQRN